MKKIFKKIINPTNLLILLFGICFFLINKGLIAMDDEVYKNSFNSIPSFIAWLADFYKVWGGRITPMTLTNIFANLPIMAFRIVNSIMLIITVLASYKIITILMDNWNDKMKNITLIILFCSIFFISIPVINTAVIWLCGATVYLWPITTMLVALIPFISALKGKKIGKQYYIFGILANIIAAFSEQTSAILIVFGAISIICCKIEKKEINKLLIAHYIIIIILSSINFFAPGNSARSYSEEIKWYPSFDTLSIGDKLVQGYIQLANHLINNTTILFSMVAILSSILIITNKQTKKINKCIAVLPIIYVLAKFLPFNSIERFYVFEKFGTYTLYSLKAFVQLVANAFIVGLIAAQLIYVFKNKKTGIITAIIYCASICSALTISFSPTIYASGNRIYATTDFLLVLINGILWTQLLQKFESKNKIIKVILIVILVAILLIVSVLCYVELYQNGTNMLIY